MTLGGWRIAIRTHLQQKDEDVNQDGELGKHSRAHNLCMVVWFVWSLKW